jgi:hypothetical protein
MVTLARRTEATPAAEFSSAVVLVLEPPSFASPAMRAE